MDILKKLGFTIENKSSKERIYEECNKLQISEKDTDLIYEYYKNNIKEFKINPKAFFSTEKIVDIIIHKLNIRKLNITKS